MAMIVMCLAAESRGALPDCIMPDALTLVVRQDRQARAHLDLKEGICDAAHIMLMFMYAHEQRA